MKSKGCQTRTAGECGSVSAPPEAHCSDPYHCWHRQTICELPSFSASFVILVLVCVAVFLFATSKFSPLQEIWWNGPISLFWILCVAVLRFATSKFSPLLKFQHRPRTKFQHRHLLRVMEKRAFHRSPIPEQSRRGYTKHSWDSDISQGDRRLGKIECVLSFSWARLKFTRNSYKTTQWPMHS
jgi:hypothetical protein